MRTSVRNELVAAIRFFAGRMNNDKYKLSSFEQVLNINRLLLDNFGDCINEKEKYSHSSL